VSWWDRGAVVGVMLASTACLVEQNPDFMASEGASDEATDTGDCGACGNVCEFGGEMLSCVDEQCTGTVVFTDLPDTYVDSVVPEQNFGSDPVLIVDATRTTYIELPSIDAIPNSATIEELALYLTCVPEPGASFEIYRVETSWDELLLTGSTAPGLDQSLISSVSPAIGQNVIELVDLLPSWRMGNPKRSLAFGPDPNAGPVAVECSSREGNAPPFLLVTLRW
jgi:hypothetical protein